jgi:deoxyribonuclease-4
VYLINLAAQDTVLREKSLQTFREEMTRASALGADYLVVHPGSSLSNSCDIGMSVAIESIRQAFTESGLGLVTSDAPRRSRSGLTILIENSAGQGSSLCWSFEQVAEMLSALDGLPVGVCLDTAHAFASGYDISTAAGLSRTLRRIDKCFGLDSVKLIHCNDSKAPLGSRVDRHQHIGLGSIGAEAFRRLTRASELRETPFILETPIEKDRNDEWNVKRLRELGGVR